MQRITNDAIDFKKIIKEKHASIHAITCSLCQFDEKQITWKCFNLKILKQRVVKEMIPL
jgi:lipopolysaccharide biosynthesis regulator YciM